MEDRLMAYWSSAFASLALALAAMGLFALLSCYVAGRRNKIGIRMARASGGLCSGRWVRWWRRDWSSESRLR
jgi:hypothetical protein